MLMFKHSLTVNKKAFGTDHPRITNTLGNMVMAQMVADDPATVAIGEAGVRLALQALTKVHNLPESHPWVVKFREALE